MLRYWKPFLWIAGFAHERSGWQPAISTLLSESPTYYQALWLFKINVLSRLCPRVWVKVSFMDESGVS